MPVSWSAKGIRELTKLWSAVRLSNVLSYVVAFIVVSYSPQCLRISVNSIARMSSTASTNSTMQVCSVVHTLLSDVTRDDKRPWNAQPWLSCVVFPG